MSKKPRRSPVSFDSATARITAYREVLCDSEPGRRVLEDLLVTLGWFDPCVTEADRALLNHARDLLQSCGILHPENTREVVDSLCDCNSTIIVMHAEKQQQERNQTI